MEDYYFDLHMIGSVKAKSFEEAMLLINSYNIVGANLLTTDKNNKTSLQKIKLHDVDVSHGDPAAS